MNLLDHWRLRERPFEATWDTRYFFASADHEEALNRLLYTVGEGSMNVAMLSGEIGCGKTLTRAVFASRLDPERFRVVTLENSSFPFNDLLGGILSRIEPQGTPASRGRTAKFARCQRFENRLKELDGEGRHLVLLLDEAQDIPPAALHELRTLTNLNGGGRAYLTLVLVGQPELRAHVAKDPAINQRITLRYHLGPMKEETVADYLHHRLRAAGHEGAPVFTRSAATAIHTATRGIPREVNRVAKLSLEHAWLSQSHCVDLASVQTVVADLERHQSLPIP